MNEIIKFQTNIPEEMAFTYEDGRETEGRFGTQYYRQTTDGRVVYLQPFVEQRLLEMEIKPGERVQIGKMEVTEGRKKGIRWEIKRVDPPSDQTSDPAQPSHLAKNVPAAPVKTVPKNDQVQSTTPRIPPQRVAPAPAIPVQNTATAAQPEPSPFEQPLEDPKPVVHTQTSNILRSCLMSAIDAARDAQQYAARVGFPLVFGPQEVQDMAISLYIQMSKQANINLMNRNAELRANGGTDPWRH